MERKKQESNSREAKTFHLNVPESFSEELKERLEESSNNKNLNDFYSAWKSESGFSLLLIEKLSIIVNNYFKMSPELKKRNE